jgi:uncharacterized protein (UPF0333 family)
MAEDAIKLVLVVCAVVAVGLTTSKGKIFETKVDVSEIVVPIKL